MKMFVFSFVLWGIFFVALTTLSPRPSLTLFCDDGIIENVYSANGTLDGTPSFVQYSKYPKSSRGVRGAVKTNCRAFLYK